MSGFSWHLLRLKNRKNAGIIPPGAPPRDRDGANLAGTTEARENCIGGQGASRDVGPGVCKAESSTRGESGVMGATVDTLEETQILSRSVPQGVSSGHGNDLSAEPLHGEPLSMKFFHPSGSRPLPGYTIKRGVGIGGFGEVYFALSDAGKEVALKSVQRNLEIELRGVTQCLNLKHPNLVSLHDIRFDESGQAWIVMEYVAGESMRAVLDEAPRGIPPHEVLRWFAGLAAGVAHLHHAGIVHRDLKPGNIFDDRGTIKIGDYGLSKYISASRRGGHTESIGTLHYMAPEVGRGSYGREIDIYAMGVILYELLTGRLPFDGESTQEIIMKHLTANPDLTGIADPYRMVIWQALQKNPSSRQQSVAEMIAPLGIELDSQGMPRTVDLSALHQRGHGAAATSPAAARWPHDYFFPRSEGFRTAAGSAQFGGSPAASSEVRFGPVRHHGSAVAAGNPSPFPATPPPYSVSIPFAPVEVPNSQPREPLARAVAMGFEKVRQWWQRNEVPGLRWLLLGVFSVLVLANLYWLFPTLMVLALLYPVYLFFYFVSGAAGSAPAHGGVPPMGILQSPLPRLLTSAEWRARKRAEYGTKPLSIQLAEVGQATVSGGLSSLVVAGGLGVFALRGESWTYAATAPYVWSAVVAMLATGIVLTLGKRWEKQEQATLGRRLAMLPFGAGVGAVAYWLAQFLFLPLDQELPRDRLVPLLPEGLLAAHVPHGLALMMAHFACLFAALRWWRIVDPLRRSRLSLWSVAVAVVAQWALNLVLPVPQPMGMMTAGVMALAMQWAAPWDDPRQKLRAHNRGLQLGAVMLACLVVPATATVPAMGQDKEPATLSVPPMDETIYPETRPSWLEDLPELEGEIAVWPVKSRLFLSQREARENLEAQVHGAVLAYAEHVLGESLAAPLALEKIGKVWQVELDEIPAKDRYQGTAQVGGEVRHEEAVMLRFDSLYRDQLQKAWRENVLRDRMISLGIVVGGGLSTLLAATGLVQRRNRQQSIRSS